MAILEADHPVVVAAKLEVRLPQTVGMFPLETLRPPSLSRLIYRMVQASLTDDPVSMIMVYFEALVAEMASYLAWAPTVPFPELDDLLSQGIVKLGTFGPASLLFRNALPAFSLVPVPPIIEHFPVNLCLVADGSN